MGKIKEAWPALLPVSYPHIGEVLEDIPNVFYSLDLKPRLRFTFVSDNVEPRFGYVPEELVEDVDRWIANVHPEADTRPRWMDASLRGLERQAVEYRVRCKQGGYVWVHDEYRVVRNGAGSAVKVVGSWIDVSKRKAAELARRQSEVQLRQALDERERLSRDLHDGITQSLYAIGLGLEESQRVLLEDGQAAKEIIAQAIRGLNEVIREVRKHIVWSGPQVLTPQQLRADLRALNEAVKGANRLRFRLDLDADAVARLSVDAAHNVLNIVREAMSNSLRHSKGHSGLVSLCTHGHGVRLVIEDDGFGFDPKRVARHGMGLKNIAVRVAELGATLEIDTSPGRGTTITIDLPTRHGEELH